MCSEEHEEKLHKDFMRWADLYVVPKLEEYKQLYFETRAYDGEDIMIIFEFASEADIAQRKEAVRFFAATYPVDLSDFHKALLQLDQMLWLPLVAFVPNTHGISQAVCLSLSIGEVSEEDVVKSLRNGSKIYSAWSGKSVTFQSEIVLRSRAK